MISATGPTCTAVAADSLARARFTADPANPVLGAEQLLAGLSFVHFENAFLSDTRGVVVTPAGRLACLHHVPRARCSAA